MKIRKCKQSSTTTTTNTIIISRFLAVDSRKRRRRISIPRLSLDIISNILSWVSPEFLHNVLRFVSKSWATLISSTHFVKTHLSRSTVSFMFKNTMFFPLLDSSAFKIRHTLFQDWFVKLKQGSLIRFFDSVDGLILFSITTSCYLHLLNPITNQHLRLPRLPNPTSLKILITANIAYISPTRQIKIICRFLSTIPNRCLVLTIASNMSWKILEHTSLLDFVQLKYSVSIGSLVIYWCPLRFSDYGTYWAIDLEDESVHSFHFPFHYSLTYFMPMGRDLYAASQSFKSILSPELVIRKLKDVLRCEWVEVFRTKIIDFGLTIHEVVRCYAWFENEKILIYSIHFSDLHFPPSFKAFDFIHRKNWDLVPINDEMTFVMIQSYITSLMFPFEALGVECYSERCFYEKASPTLS